MENFNVNALEINAVFEKGSHTKKFKVHSKKLIESVQRLLLVASFLYVPVYVGLLCLNIIHIISTFSAYCLISYILLILFFMLMNNERPFFAKKPAH